MIFLVTILLLTTLLLCYAGYIFLIVDRRPVEVLDTETFEALDDKNYSFVIPDVADDYEELRLTDPPDKRTLPRALIGRAIADIPLIHQLEKDLPRMSGLFRKGLLPHSVWEQVLEAEQAMHSEITSVMEEAERLNKGWGGRVFQEAHEVMQHEKMEQQRMEQMKKEAAVLSLQFTKLSGDVVNIQADGRKVTQKTAMSVRPEMANEELPAKCSVEAELCSGTGDTKQTFTCEASSLELDVAQEKQWKQVGRDPAGLRLQVRFLRRTHGAKAGFVIQEIRATLPENPVPIGGL